MRVTLVRHGVTEWNTLGRWQGQTDTPLSEAGEHQARRLARRLRAQRFDLAFSSDLTRARRTAQIALPDVTAHLDERLREANFGEFDGSTIEQNRLHPLFDAWVMDPYHSPTPGGESLLDVQRRALEWLGGLPAEANVVAFSHSVLIRTLVSHLVHLPVGPRASSVFPFAINTPHTSLTVITLKAGEWTLERLGDDAHLERLDDPRAEPR